MVEQTGSDKHSSLLCYTINYCRKEIYDVSNGTLSMTLYSNGKLQALPVDIRRWGKRLAVTNILAYYYEESVVVRFKSNLLLLSFCLHIINYNS
jgi:hypothetical protein